MLLKVLNYKGFAHNRDYLDLAAFDCPKRHWVSWVAEILGLTVGCMVIAFLIV